MDPKKLTKVNDFEWRIERTGPMRVPGVIYASEALLRDMDDKVAEQVSNVAALPGIKVASFAMPDAHWGYGFPIGGVAAFDENEGGVVSAGGVGFDISCGVRTLCTDLQADDIKETRTKLANALYTTIPAGVGSTGQIKLNLSEMDELLVGGARWAVEHGYGLPEDLERIEERGCIPGADPAAVSTRAKERQHAEMGTLGSGNHYLEVQRVSDLYDKRTAQTYGLSENQVVVCIHSGSRGLGHQIGTDYLREMVTAAPRFGIPLPERELACAPIKSELGQRYLGAMRAGINCALANREILTHLAREAFGSVLPDAQLKLLYDVSHNTCKVEEHRIDGHSKRLFVHRKGATRSFGPHHPSLQNVFGDSGQPVLIGGTMGTSSYILAGTEKSMTEAFGSACHGAGRAMSRRQATKQWKGGQVTAELAQRGIILKGHSTRGIAEEAPGAYKDVTAVVDAAEEAGLANKVARLEPLICVKG